MQVDLTNGPLSYQEMRDTIVKDMEGCIWYFDDILIYGRNTENEHQAIVEKVLQQHVEHRLAVNFLKSKFDVKESILLAHVINGEEVKMDPSTLETMFKCAIPIQKKAVEALLDFAN